MTTSIRPLTATDEKSWRELWAGYVAFYQASVSEDVTEHTWHALLSPGGHRGLAAIDDAGALIGFAHYLIHPSTWSKTGYCYLEDLFVAPAGRGRGAGRALIDAVCAAADKAHCDRIYWVTQSGNSSARALYDRVATLSDFVQYRR